MDPLRKSRSGVISVIVALVAVGVFWLIFIFGSEGYKTYKLEGDLKKTLQAIQPPAGAKVESITVVGKGLVQGTYDIDSSFDRVKEHYVAEFARHGFAYRGEDRVADGQTNVHFCAPGYAATLSPLKLPFEVKTQQYFIALIKQEGSKC